MNLRRLRSKAVLVAVSGVILVGALVALAFGEYRARERSRELGWELELERHYRDTDAITLDVGSIQFLRQGYSISLDEVVYGPNGVTLAGTIGNPYLIELSSLTLVFEVRRPYYTLREEYLDDPLSLLFSSDLVIGKSQVAVGMVAPGSTASFRTTIPNVKQSSDQYEVGVSFSGERYQYMR